MIREFNGNDTDNIMEIWLESTIDAHKFIPEEYWRKNYPVVRDKYLPSSKTFVYQKGNMIKGFISIVDGSTIGGLFVDVKYQGNGIGTKLIEYAKKKYDKLNLAVYSDNLKSLHFYKKCGFIIEREQINEDSGAKEYLMSWAGNPKGN